jgi:hypothetical protein
MSTRTQAPGGDRGEHEGMSSAPLRPRTTTAFFVQAAISFGISLAAMVAGIAFLHDSPWVRSFLALGLLYVVTSSFTLAKCVRDRQEEEAIVSRVDQARLDKLLAEQDLLHLDSQ